MGLYKCFYSVVISIVLLFSFSSPTFAAGKLPPDSVMEVIIRTLNDLEAPITRGEILEIAEYPTGDGFAALANKLYYELTLNVDLEEAVIHKELILTMIKALGDMGCESFEAYDERNGVLTLNHLSKAFVPLVAILETEHGNRSYYSELHQALIHSIKNANSKQEILQSYVSLTKSSDPNALSRREALAPKKIAAPTFVMNEDKYKRISEFLELHIIEQDEVIERYKDMVYQAMVLGFAKRKLPFITEKMGPPGNGKDTSAEALVDALFGEEGAHAKIDKGVPMLYRLPVMRDKSDIWKVLGSPKGYVGSFGDEKITPFVRWLVKFSAGRYKIEEEGRNPRIIENPDWKPGVVIAGYYPPEMGVLYVNEFHNWSREAKDIFLKQFLEKGYISLNNAGSGEVTELYVPINIDIASNDGIGLYSNRELDGRVVGGRQKTFEEQMEAYNQIRNDKELLRNEILKTNSLDPAGVANDSRRGISEEVLNRIPPSGLIAMKPLSPQALQTIAEMKLKSIQKILGDSKGIFGPIKISWTPELITYIQEFHYQPEANARPIQDNAYAIVERTLYDALKEKKHKTTEFVLDLKKNDDNTANLLFKDPQTQNVLFEQPIRATFGDRPRQPITNDQLDKIVNLEGRLNARIAGNKKVLHKLSEYILTSEADRNKKRVNFQDHDSARLLMFFGLSSTGKTEVGKVLDEELLKNGINDRFAIDFNLVNSREELKEKIYGRTDNQGHAVASDFMKYYDRYNGQIILHLEEITNAPLEALAVLYDLFREPVVQGFSDKKPRSMSNVTIVGTGNAGAEWFKNVPSDIPDDERMAIYSEIYNRSMRDPNFLRETLKARLPEPLINRIQLDNTFFFEPFGFEAVRDVTQKKIQQYIEKLRPAEGAIGWNIKFASDVDYLRMVAVIEESGFRIAEQGASIDGYVNTNFYKSGLKALLLRNKVPSNADVVIKARDDNYQRVFRGTMTSTHLPPEDNDIIFDVVTSDGQKLEWSLPRNERKFYPDTRDEDKILTAYHEAGHNIVGMVLLSDKIMPDMITTVPGVDNFGGQWLRYLGLASSDEKELLIKTRQAAIELMAGLFGGEVAQTLATKGAVHDAGKSNDMERATSIAREAILRWGVSEKWGRYSVSDEQFNQLSGDRVKLYEGEMKSMLDEARALARNVLLLNYDSLLVPLSTQLAEKGTLYKSDLEGFYRDHQMNNPYGSGIFTKVQATTMSSLRARFAKVYKSGRDAELLDNLPRPATVAGTAKVIKEQKDIAIAKVLIPKDAPIEKENMSQLPVGGNCVDLFAVGF